MKRLFTFVTTFAIIGSVALFAEDWPEFRGKGRMGVWNETGILEKFPEEGLTIKWRTPLKRGYTGPAVVNGRIFVMDFDTQEAAGIRGKERVLALDEETGRVLWTQEWEAHYGGFPWPNGPRATPTVDGDRVYVQGTRGVLVALNVQNGEVLWRRDYKEEFDADGHSYGASAAPLVDGDLVIALVGGEPDAKVVAFDKWTGKEIWRALGSNEQRGVSPPIIINRGGKRQLIIWHPEAVVSLNPATGEVYWEQPFHAQDGMNPTVPAVDGEHLMVSTFYSGSIMLSLDDTKPDMTVRWKSTSDSEIETDTLHAVLASPIIRDGYIYGICTYGQLRCLRVETGERVWESQDLTQEFARWSTGFIVQNGDRFFINTDRGDLVIARFTPEGYDEIDRTFLIKPTTPPGNRRRLKYVNWSHPAYANKHIYARNDDEIIAISLAAEDN